MQQQNDNDKTPTNEPLTLGGAQQLVDQWVKQYGVRYFSELTNMAVLTEEVGELARQMARIYGDQSFKQGEEPNLGDEMADVLWVLLCLANQTGVNLEEELKRNIEKKTRRDKTRHITLTLNAINLTNKVYLVSRHPSGLRAGHPLGIYGGVLWRL